jgi:hypothetical protein
MEGFGMSIETMRQALDALEAHADIGIKSDKTITALRTAIEQAEKQEPVAHSVVAGALFDFMGWLTSRDKRLTLSSTDEASPAVEAITEFAKMRGLRLEDAHVEHWQAILTTPPAAQRQWVGLTEKDFSAINQSCLTKLQAATSAESILKEKNHER